MSTNPGDANWWGRVQTGNPQISTLVSAFGDDIDRAADAIVLRGYSGKTTIVKRAIEFLDIAKRNGGDGQKIQQYTDQIKALKVPEEDNLRRIYLTPRLDRYVDFHQSCLIGWRFEPAAVRQDAITVWLRAFDDSRVPIPYRVVQETTIGPSSSTYLSGALLDDYLNQPSTQSSAWGTQAGLYGGGGKRTTPACGD